MATWRINNKNIDIGPFTLDYVLVSDPVTHAITVRRKYTHTKIEMARYQPNQQAYKPDFPTYTMIWPRASNKHIVGGNGIEALSKTLKELPLNKAITMKDGYFNQDNINIEIINRKIDYVRTNPDNEVIESVTLTIRFI